MKRSGFKFFILSIVLFTASSMQAQQGKMRQNTMNRNYNPATVETVSGTIADILNVNMWGVHIKINTGNGTTGIHIGPDWFIKDKISLSKGDSITVTGSRVTIDGEVVIIAKSLSKGGLTVQLRNENGVPLWAGSGKGKKR